MSTKRRSYEAGHKRKYLVVIDDTEECDRAVYWAAKRAGRTKSQLVMLRVIDTGEHNQQWLGVADIMKAEATEAANAAFDKYAVRTKEIASITPDRVIRAGDPAEEILCADPADQSGFVRRQDYYLADCGIAAQSLMLAARAEGLGTVFVEGISRRNRFATCGHPGEHAGVWLFPLGYPAEEKKEGPKRKPLEEDLLLRKVGEGAIVPLSNGFPFQTVSVRPPSQWVFARLPAVVNTCFSCCPFHVLKVIIPICRILTYQYHSVLCIYKFYWSLATNNHIYLIFYMELPSDTIFWHAHCCTGIANGNGA